MDFVENISEILRIIFNYFMKNGAALESSRLTGAFNGVDGKH